MKPRRIWALLHATIKSVQIDICIFLFGVLHLGCAALCEESFLIANVCQKGFFIISPRSFTICTK